ncbi:MAG: glycogen/starch/alpha-glucan phosphorylase [Lagierella massiliensis]|nr:glycogen/starch/alpha-glucan phosphorylase [Lagierella massiliensis]
MNKMDKFVLANKLKEELFTRMALTPYEITNEDVYEALVKNIKEMFAYSWRESKGRLFSQKQIYIFSFEYNTGKFLNKNLRYLGIENTVRESLEILGYNASEVFKIDKLPLLGEGDLGDLSNFILESGCKYPIKAYGLRYDNGRFKQKIVNNMQVEETESWVDEGFPWEIKRNKVDRFKVSNLFVKSYSYDLPIVGNTSKTINTLRLFKSQGEGLLNPMNLIEGEGLIELENYFLTKALSSFLYMEDVNYLGKKIRLSQEYFLAECGVRDMIRDLKLKGVRGDFKGKFKVLLNENHTLITIPVFMMEFCKNFNLSKEETLDIIWNNFEYRTFEKLLNNSKIWSKSLIEEVCPDIQGYLDFILNSFKIYQSNYDYYDFNELVPILIQDVRPLSKMQKREFEQKKQKHFINTKQYEIDKNILNLSPWLWEINPRLYNILTKNLKEEILNKPNSLKDLTKIKNKNLLQELEKVKDLNKLEIKEDIFKEYEIIINPKSIFIMSLRTFQERRRQFLTCLYLTEKYFQLIENSNIDMIDITYFIGGLSAPKYLASKYVIEYINILKDLVNKDRSIKEKLKIVFIEDLDRSKVMNLVRGCNIVEQISTPGLELVGGDILKYMLNGAVVHGSTTGLNLELREMNKSGIYLFGNISTESVEVLEDDVYDEDCQNKRLEILIQKIRRSNFVELKDCFEKINGLILKYNDSFKLYEEYDSYYKSFEKMIFDYRDKDKWVERAMDNISLCGEFSGPFVLE